MKAEANPRMEHLTLEGLTVILAYLETLFYSVRASLRSEDEGIIGSGIDELRDRSNVADVGSKTRAGFD